PLMAQVRLGAAGMRPLSNIVDATNYVLLEMGQPLHPFDLATLAGPGIVVRRASEAEVLTTLDGTERKLGAEDLLIADTERGVAIAGIMGGAETEVSAGTADVLLESAHFSPLGVLRTARRLGLRTEASVRFERGADPEAVAPAAARAARLIAEWSGGTVLAGEVDAGSVPERRSLDVRPSRAELLIGTPLRSQDIREALGRLRLPSREHAEVVTVEVPGYRFDLEREADLIEEVARVRGYMDLPSTLPGIRQAGGLSAEQRVARRMRDALVRAGMFEARSTSFVSDRDLSIFEDARRDGLRVANPISEEDARLRTALLPGLLAAARRNLAHRNPSARLFEVGHVFLPGPVEAERVAIVLAGSVAEEWSGERRGFDVLDAKGVLEILMQVLGLATWSTGEAPGAPYHPGRSAAVLLDGEPIGALGEIHPGVAEALDLPGRVAAFELDARALIEGARTAIQTTEPSRLPPVHRDLAFVVDAGTPAGEVRAAVVEAAGGLLDRIALFDVFEGDPLPPGKKSLAFSLDFRATDRTLTDDEVEPLVAGISSALASRFGAELRTG
ncbi:MAG TPA: phenylalanine--tRNA ligase subunit beta, partial [Actinomycetota bacterium]|nr:phenylalanine--tRNA ligase subunit beta [Actinomycetota bacterium]